MKSERALTEVVSVTLIILLIVTLSLVTIALIFGNLSFPQKFALIAADITNQTIYNKNIITVYHRGGEIAELGSTGQVSNNLGVYVDTKSGSNKTQPIAPGILFEPGTMIYIFNTTSGYRVTNNRTDLSSSAAQPIIACPVSVRIVDETANTLIAEWDSSCIPPTLAGAIPTVTAITPNTGTNATTISITNLAGTNFLTGATVNLNRTGYADIVGTSVNVVSPTQITCTFDLTGKAAGQWNVAVTNTGGQSGILANGFTITTPAPAVISITPNSGYNDTSVSITNLAGTGLITGATVKLNSTGSPDIPATGVTVISSTQITCTFALNGVPAGARNVVVTNPDGKSGMLANGFTVNQALLAPIVTSITPNTGNRGWPVSITNLAGSRFQPGAIVKLVNSTAGPDIIATSVVINPANTSITCTFDLTGVPAARRNVTVTNPDGKTGTLANGFMVNSNTPTITSSIPATGAQAATVIITRLLGSGFQPGAIVVYSQGATTIPLQSVSVISSTNITGTLVIPSNAPTGSYSVTVTNTDGKTVTRANTFTVSSNAPTLTARSPTTAPRGWPVSVTLTGTLFQSGATVNMTRSGVVIDAYDVVVVSPASITCKFNLVGATAANNWVIRVTNPDGKSSGTQTFTITNTVTVTSILPTSGQRGTTVAITNIAGTGFQPGVTEVRFTTNTGTTNQILLTNINVESSTKISGTLVIPAGQLTTTDYYVRVTNADATNGISGSRIFRVTV